MNISDSVGESSSKRQENGDASCGTERPLKKARFAWQVKGKYHLRNESNESSKDSATTSSNDDCDSAGPSSECNAIPNGFVGNTEQNLEILGDYLLKQDFNTLDSVIDTDKSLLTPSTRLSTDTLPYPRYISSFENSYNRPSSFEASNSDTEQISIPMSMVVSNNYCEEQCIARWQARQMAKGFVDNTINRVLDSWTHPPLPPHMNNTRFLALDVAEFINNLPGDNTIENEGILMAISAHGLQNTSNSSSDNLGPTEESTYCSDNTNQKFLCPPESPTQSVEEIMNQDPNAKEESYEQSVSDLGWSYTDDSLKNDKDMTSFSFFPESDSYQYFTESGNIHSTNFDYESDQNSAGNHYDFMDAAVSFAIQTKGLTTFGSDYG